LGMVRYKDIPTVAPDASAYCRIVTDIVLQDAVDPTTPGAQIVCGVDDFCPETVMLIRSSYWLDTTSTDIPFLCPYTKAVQQSSPLPLFSSTSPVVYDPNFLWKSNNAWLGSRQLTYTPGVASQSYVLCADRITSLKFSYQVLDPLSLSTLSYLALNQFLQQTNQPMTSQQLRNALYLYWAVTLSLVTARYNQSTPFHNIVTADQAVGVNPTTFSPQAGYVSRAWNSALLPAILAKYIDGVGPVNVRGHIVVPLFLMPPDDDIQSSAVLFPAIGTIGQSASFIPPSGPGYGNPALLTGTGAPPDASFSPNGTAILNATIQLFYPSGTANLRTLYWNVNAAYFIGLWDRLHKQFIAGASLSSSLIHTHNGPCGNVAAMLSRSQLFQTADTVPVPEQALGATWSYNINIFEAKNLGSMVVLGGDEVVDAVMCRWSTLNQSNLLPLAAFAMVIPTGSATSTLIETFGQRTFSTESSFSKALSAREAAFDPVVRSVKGIEVVSADDSDGCYIRDLLKSVGRELFNSLRLAGPVAAGVACNFFVPGSGSVCAVGSDKLLETVSSFIGVEADNHESVSGSDMKEILTSIKKKKVLKKEPERAPKKKAQAKKGRSGPPPKKKKSAMDDAD